MSFIVINPTSFPFSSIRGSFSIFFLRKISFASSRVIPSLPVTRCSLDVITFTTGTLGLSSKIISLLVSRPISLFSSSTTGRPEISCFAISSFALTIVSFSFRTIGFCIIPDSYLFTLSTSSACFSMGIFL